MRFMRRIPRSLRSRLLGTTGVPFPLPFGVIFLLVVLHGIAVGSRDIPAGDRLSPAGAVFTVALLTSFALGGISLGIVDWRRCVVLRETGVDLHNWRQRLVPWSDIRAIEFCQVRMGRGTVPAAALVHWDGRRTELRSLVLAGRRVRQDQVDLLARTCADHGVNLCSDGSWWWRRINLNGTRGGLRTAKC
jgi:hypothetical protein